MIEDPDGTNRLSASEIRAALEKVLASPPFSHAMQLSAFLRFVVESTLAGRADLIKSYTIGVDALGRGNDFDPQVDAIVRVEAGRVRKALANYYGSVGADESVLIELPRGSYVPTFSRRRVRRTAKLLGPASRRIVQSSRASIAVASAVLTSVVVTLLICGTMSVFSTTEQQSGSFDLAATTASVKPARHWPTVVVHHFESNLPTKETMTTLSRKLRNSLARFDGIKVFSDEGPGGQPYGRSEGGVYTLSAYLDALASDTIRLTFRLDDAASGAIVWTQTFDLERNAIDDTATDEIVRKVAAALAQPYGIIFARELGASIVGGSDGPYRCVVRASEAYYNNDVAAREDARRCLDQMPANSEALATSALLKVQSYYDSDGDRELLDRALRAASRAIELRPQSARAHTALMNALLARGNIDAALARGQRAVELNPHDMTVVAALGLALVTSGDFWNGRTLLLQAEADSPVRLPILDFGLFLAAVALGDDASGAYHASFLAARTDQFALLARAAEAGRIGDRGRARSAIDALIAGGLDWRSDPRRHLQRLFPSPVLVDAVARNLAAAGLDVTN